MTALLWLLRLLLGWTGIAAFVQAFGDPQTALLAIIVICVTIVLVVAMVVWQSIHLGRVRIVADTIMVEKSRRPVRRTRRFLGYVIWEYEQVVGEAEPTRDGQPNSTIAPVREPPRSETPDAGG